MKFSGEEKLYVGVIAAIVLLNVAWVSFVVWAIYSVVKHVTGS